MPLPSGKERTSRVTPSSEKLGFTKTPTYHGKLAGFRPVGCAGAVKTTRLVP